jgi:RNA polymerase sigma factor (sigma-70 family)
MVAQEIKLKDNSTEDQALVARMKSDDIEAFEELVHKYKKKAYYLAYKMLSNRDDAEDISQEAFLKVFNDIGSFKGNSSFSTWFYTIIVNLCRSHLRHRSLFSRVTFSFKRKDALNEEPGPPRGLVNKGTEDSPSEQFWNSYLNNVYQKIDEDYFLLRLYRNIFIRPKLVPVSVTLLLVIFLLVFSSLYLMNKNKKYEEVQLAQGIDLFEDYEIIQDLEIINNVDFLRGLNIR